MYPKKFFHCKHAYFKHYSYLNQTFILLTCIIGLSSVYVPSLYAVPATTPDAPRASSANRGTDLLSIHYILDKIEDDFEKSNDKAFKVNWDFEIVYHDSKVLIIMTYDARSEKTFSKLSTEQLSKLITQFTTEITKTLSKDIEIEGMIIKDDAKTPTYTFIYKEGQLHIS